MRATVSVLDPAAGASPSPAASVVSPAVGVGPLISAAAPAPALAPGSPVATGELAADAAGGGFLSATNTTTMQIAAKAMTPVASLRFRLRWRSAPIWAAVPIEGDETAPSAARCGAPDWRQDCPRFSA